MLIVIAIITAVLVAGGIFLYRKTDMEVFPAFPIAIGGLGFLITIIVMFALTIDYSYKSVIDDKITLYQTENAQIEERVENVVSQYVNYESSTFDKTRENSPITLVTMFPELKADEVMKKQIDLYVANNTKIKELEEEKIEYQVLAWWLFFGSE